LLNRPIISNSPNKFEIIDNQDVLSDRSAYSFHFQ